MKAVKTIEIDLDLHKAIEANRRAFEERENDILKRMLAIQMKGDDQSGIESRQDQKREGFYSKGVFLPKGRVLRGERNGISYEAEVTVKGIEWKGKLYPSLSAAASTATGTSTNGWIFWHYVDEFTGKMVSCRTLRK
jgi:hypothetical protein